MAWCVCVLIQYLTYSGALPKGDSTIYVFNGFFMAMREKFVAKGVSIYYFVVQWDAAKLSWADFR